jgi:hypothetical protein
MFTVTTTEQVAGVVPCAPVAVMTYVVVCVGLTVIGPFNGTVPGKLLTVTVVAFVCAQAMVAVPPVVVIVAGLAAQLVNVGLSAGCGRGLTVIVVRAVSDPKRFVAVSVYSVVAEGVTDLVPVADTVPTVGEIVIVSAFSTFHDRVDESPARIVIGFAVNATIRGASPRSITVTVTVQVAAGVPCAPCAVIVYVVVCVGDTIRDPLGSTDPMPPVMVTDSAF